MTRLLKVFALSSDSSTELGILQAGEVSVGRDAEADISLPSNAVSFQHGVFVRIRNHWFFKDLGSTNGSWLNDVRVAPEVWKLVRPGDVLQLADVVLKFTSAEPISTGGGPGAAGGRTLLVFSKGDFVDEYPIPEVGKALIVGGAKADLDIEGDTSEVPALIIEKRGEILTAYSVGRRSPFVVNGREEVDPTPLKDGDEVVIASYVIFLNDPFIPPSAGVSSRGSGAFQGRVAESTAHAEPAVSPPQESPAASLRAWSGAVNVSSLGLSPGPKPVSKAAFFGHLDDGDDAVDDTVSIDPEEVRERVAAARAAHHSFRSMQLEPDEYHAPQTSRYSLATLEGKLIVFTGLCLVGTLVCLAYYLVAG